MGVNRKPKVIKLRVMTANGRKEEYIFEDVVYLAVIEPLRERAMNKTVFVIDLDSDEPVKHNTNIEKN